MTTPIQPGSEAARALYPLVEHTTFLNHASASPLSTRVVTAMHEWISHWQSHGGRDDMAMPIEDFRGRFATLIGATAAEIAIVPNTSEGLLIVAQGFPWQQGDALLTVESEFTANVYPWLPLRERGVEIIRLPARDHRIPPEEIEAAMKANPRIRLLAISFVQFATGFRSDLAALGELCKKYDVRFCVDAIQGAGALPIDVRAMGIDFLSAGGPKWLMGPIGAGFFYARRELIQRLQSSHVGWLGTVDPREYFRHDAPLAESAQRFEAGTLPWPSLWGLAASVETLLEVGIPAIENHLQTLGEQLIAGLDERGYHVATPRPREERGGIVVFTSDDREPSDIVAHLDAQHITISARGPFVRVSPHFYNNSDDIDRLLNAL